MPDLGILKRRTANTQAIFLRSFAKSGVIAVACKSAKVTRECVRLWRNQDAEFEEKFLSAEREAADLLEKEARRRAMTGVTEPVFYQGEQCGTVRKYSDTLLIFLLKGNKPEKFRERHEHTGPGGGPIQVEDARSALLAKLPTIASETEAGGADPELEPEAGGGDPS